MKIRNLSIIILLAFSNFSKALPQVEKSEDLKPYTTTISTIDSASTLYSTFGDPVVNAKIDTKVLKNFQDTQIFNISAYQYFKNAGNNEIANILLDQINKNSDTINDIKSNKFLFQKIAKDLEKSGDIKDATVFLEQVSKNKKVIQSIDTMKVPSKAIGSLDIYDTKIKSIDLKGNSTSVKLTKLNTLGVIVESSANIWEGYEDYQKYKHEGALSRISYGYALPTIKVVGNIINLANPLQPVGLGTYVRSYCESCANFSEAVANPISAVVDTGKRIIDIGRLQNSMRADHLKSIESKLTTFKIKTNNLNKEISRQMEHNSFYHSKDFNDAIKKSDLIISSIIKDEEDYFKREKADIEQTWKSFRNDLVSLIEEYITDTEVMQGAKTVTNDFFNVVTFNFDDVKGPLNIPDSVKKQHDHIEKNYKNYLSLRQNYINELKKYKEQIKAKMIFNFINAQNIRNKLSLYASLDKIQLKNLEQNKNNEKMLNKMFIYNQNNTSHFGTTTILQYNVYSRKTVQENPYLAKGSAIIEAPADIVLNWGNRPADLDSHLTGPINAQSSERFHVNYQNKGSLNSNPNVLLYRDDTSHGANSRNRPEQTRINVTQPGVYNFYVHDFSNKGSPSSRALSNSGAVVSVHTAGNRNLPEGDNLGRKVTQFTVPKDKIGTVWHTFELDTRRNTIKPVNTFHNDTKVIK